MKKANKFLSKILSVFLALVLCVGMTTPAFAASFDDLQAAISDNISESTTETKTEETEAETEETEAETEETEAETNETEAETNETEAETNEAETETNEAETETNEAETETNEAETETNEAETETEETEAKTEETEAKTEETEAKTETNEPKTETNEPKTETKELEVNASAPDSEPKNKFNVEGDKNDYYGYGKNEREDESKGWDIWAWITDGIRNIKIFGDVTQTKDDKAQNITITGKDQNGNKQDVNLDLNGNSITGTGDTVVNVESDATLTVTDSKGNGFINGSGTTVIDNSGTLNLEGGTVHASANQGITVNSGATATISEDATVKTDDTSTNGRAVSVSKGGSLTTLGKIISKCIGIYTTGNVTVNNGTVKGNSYGVYSVGGNTVVDGGTVSGAYGAYTWGGNVQVKNGTVNGTTAGIYAKSYNGDNGTVNVNGGTVIGQKYGVYTKGSTIMNSTVNVTGGTVESTGSSGYGVYAINGDVTVSGNGTVKADGDYAYGVTAFGSDVKVNGGKIEAGLTGVYADEYGKASTFEMTNGSIRTGGCKIVGTGKDQKVYSAYGVTLKSGASGTVSGGTISLKDGIDTLGTYGIAVWYGTNLTVNDGTITGQQFAISGNGTEGKGDNTTILIAGGEIHGATTGIYHPQVNGKMTITGGNITGGETGVEIRAGKLNVTGGNITGLGDHLDATPNGNGSTVSGAGIAIAQHVTKQPIEVNIYGGVITGCSAPYEINIEKNSAEDISKIAVKVTGGKFVTKSEASVFSEDVDGFIIGAMSKEGVAEYSLGIIPWDEMKDFSSFEKKEDGYTGQVNCIQVEHKEYPYRVGYLTGEPNQLYTALTVGSTNDKLSPLYSLSGEPLKEEVLNAVFVDADNPDGSIHGSEYRSVITSWTSADESIATVDENGVVTAVSASSEPIAIVATLINGETVTFYVTVSAPAPSTPEDPYVPPISDDDEDDDPRPPVPEDPPLTDDHETDIPEEPVLDIPDEDVPLADIPDEDVPMADIPDEEVPLADIPDEEVPLADIPDEDVPLADVPQTGDNSCVWSAMTLLAACGLAVLYLRKKREEA